ncbi:hypothetical protein P9990_26625 (plasmid) [Prescottella equi]|uniref:hypothetical protein n=1 Tax=Rhodococcus hoagii TaxID=43767 RepID=UPI00257744A8|nr:hypothetical protein [Prescottella equi]WJJ14388.1 hypothetical protein P9990_26625 [Prescottella equi]
MTTLASGTRRLAASGIAAAAAAAMLTGCSSSSPDTQSTFNLEEVPVYPAYTNQFTVGSATFTTNLPAGTRAFEMPGADSKALLGVEEKSTFLVSWPGHDLSTISYADFTKSVEGNQKFVDESVKWLLWPIDCMSFDTAQNQDDTIDSTSPLNGQPLTYSRATDASERIGDRTFNGGGVEARASDTSVVYFFVKLDTKPCSAVMAGGGYARTSPDNPLKDFGYRLFVEGDGTVTTANP